MPTSSSKTLSKLSSEYVRNTAIVITTMRDRQGGAVKVTDFAPRFYHLGRTYRPPQLIRMIEPVAGLPRISIRIRPIQDYGGPSMRRATGSNHIRYTGGEFALRVTTDAPLSYIDREGAFVLTRSLHLVFGSDTPFEGSLDTTCREFFDRTSTYWREWVRRLAISYDWQDATIRAAITLKLSNFEETGAVVAAHTTSIPEAPGTGRNWDYRYCWLRDAYFVVQALNRLGATRTMEDFISYILTVVSQTRKIASGLQHRPNRHDGRAHRAETRGVSGGRACAYRQRGSGTGPTRYLWQCHSCGNANVFRPPSAAHGRHRSLSPA